MSDTSDPLRNIIIQDEDGKNLVAINFEFDEMYPEDAQTGFIQVISMAVNQILNAVPPSE